MNFCASLSVYMYTEVIFAFVFSSQETPIDLSMLKDEIPEVNWIPFGLRLRLTEDKKLEVWNIGDEVGFGNLHLHLRFDN